MTLTDVQQRHIATTLRHVDRLLAEVEALPPDSDEATDASSELPAMQRARMQAAIGRIRRELAMALDELGIVPRETERSPRRITETALQFADIALSELNERDLRGYGSIDRHTAEQLASVVARLRERVHEALAQVR